MKRKDKEEIIYSEDEISERLAILEEIKKKVETFDEKKLQFGTNPITELSPDEKSKPFYALIGALLSTKTCETLRLKVMNNLIEHYKKLTPEIMSKASEDILNELLDGCYGKVRKIKFILECSKVIHNNYNDIVPDNIDELKKLPGIGPKLAKIICAIGFKKIEGITVDQRSLLLLHRLEWILKDTSNDNDAMKEVEEWLPKEHWNYFSKDTILFAKYLCKPNPLCDQCPLAKHYVCKYYCKKHNHHIQHLTQPYNLNLQQGKKKKIDVEVLDNMIISEDDEEHEFLSNLDLIQLSQEHQEIKDV
ncbi:endonuclease III, putative [Entamoeba histolytica HM-1:IMSS-B]|uniref:Endonuclease III, putative n=6 Tax=Entamoeba histolytica TaxID=5759 RepID=C4LYM7_ENTH1|nr:endonuclease III, putative [Entamoeba histolytica HM-1:IMSS]EMD48263.1 endonuclease III, putative [Entamoeba histolytica KU27]EMH72463.1 endonuclease III, putative [Entamoeba histolytica HM-1:IMSS-B]EMS15021.1 endonuclease III, putative [Entamoeba histolytica HM-3:IMSS]ENY60693.1 endonuclease III, putative [Entamoeba histolytica HM-1:IMSS-A]GAT93934.1 endonuclease III putative [Entamoeba histolytica]|eukprot:XP_654116.1 endonuclease III, putative [Entamoeba histolytica HM-1:IMSS]